MRLFHKICYFDSAFISFSKKICIKTLERLSPFVDIYQSLSEITKSQNRIDRVYDDYLDDKITEELYQRKSEEYRANQKKLQRQRDNIELIDDEHFGTVFRLLNLAKSAPKLFQKANIEQKRSLLQIVLSNFSLDGDQLRWKLKEPFETMVLCSENSSLLILVDELRNY